MNSNFDERYSRHFPLKSLGRENQKKLKYRNALIAGMGGLGTVSSELLSSIGIGNLKIVDYDVIELSNLPRQKLYNEGDIGKAKVDVAEERLKLRNPNLKVDSQATRIDALTSLQLIDGVDVIVDGLDLFSSRRVLHKASYELKIPYIFAGATAEYANIMTITHRNQSPCLECVLGEVIDSREQSCEIAGIHPAILQIASGIQVAETVRVLLDQKPMLEGKMLYIDLQSFEFEKIVFQKRENCRICGLKQEGELDKGKEGEITRANRKIGAFGEALVTSLCGRNTWIIAPNWEIKWDFDQIKNKLRNKYHLAVDGKNYATFNDRGVGVSLLSSGVTTIRGAKTSTMALNTLNRILLYIFDK